MQDSGRKSNVLDRFSDPQSDPQNALSCAILNDLGGPWPPAVL
jgi:hypothetical protein